MPSRKALLIAGTIILLAAALWLIFGQGFSRRTAGGFYTAFKGSAAKVRRD